MLTIQVNLDRLAGGAGEGAAIAAALGDTRAALAGASRSAGAGGPRAAGAIADACAAWSTALDELGGAVGRLHSNLAAAARAYAVTDEQAIEP